MCMQHDDRIIKGNLQINKLLIKIYKLLTFNTLYKLQSSWENDASNQKTLFNIYLLLS